MGQRPDESGMGIIPSVKNYFRYQMWHNEFVSSETGAAVSANSLLVPVFNEAAS